MNEWLDALDAGLSKARDLDAGLDVMVDALSGFGLDSVNYDYSPEPLTEEREIVTPSLLLTRNAPASMIDLWRNAGYYQIDPVMHVANAQTTPFAWSYLEDSPSRVARILSDRTRPVADYLHDTRLTIGVTVPIRYGNGALATFTGIRFDPERNFERDVGRHISDIGVAAYMFHNFALPRLPAAARPQTDARLTRREQECLRLCAQGLSAKQIAARLGRSIGTVTLHLQNAGRKLGARNRTHAVSIAVRNSLIDCH